MFKTALLVVTKPLSQLRAIIPEYLSELNRVTSTTAYIHIQPEGSGKNAQSVNYDLVRVPFTTEVRNIVKAFYSSSSKTCSHLDIYVLVGHLTNGDVKLKKYNFKQPCDVVLIDKKVADDESSMFVQSLSKLFSVVDGAKLQYIETQEGYPDGKKARLDVSAQEFANKLVKQYSHTVVGGTYDRLHVGHKLLLTEACMLSTGKLTVGVTTGPMVMKKVLHEIMQPVNERISIVREFLTDVKPGLDYRLFSITDGFGPTVARSPDYDPKEDAGMGLIVLSQETIKGGEMINAEREKEGLPRLDVHTIELLEDTCHSKYEEEKVSSSSLRKRLLGTLLHPVQVKSHLAVHPYVIGLTGGIACGKSSVCQRLQGLGAKIVDCDKLGHKAYVKGTPGFERVVEAFGPSVVGEDGEIHRPTLGKIVFGDKAELERLNAIVWPEIARLVGEQIQQYKQEGTEVVVLDAAILLEASWDHMCHEVWTTIVPRDEVIQRLVDRNKLTTEAATQRLNAQISNTERVSRANVVLCTLWEYEYTQQQVERAWALLKQRLPIQGKSSSAKSNM
ncbi:bifunctional coenzyme A synthase-like [Dreissena polymorpha]|uniref:Bifunctional coenzyme A synthase n=1 Tax=Dreissena polymorpha TaxID=45954 RepID=A0A9D4S023_DREPO|nr:bifunctional coenzyme A synthase-like [Dreissena polymorpha]KAH3885373.1 hypothetical protein DPMN_009366 [Dreissena polymorpha]